MSWYISSTKKITVLFFCHGWGLNEFETNIFREKKILMFCIRPLKLYALIMELIGLPWLKHYICQKFYLTRVSGAKI